MSDPTTHELLRELLNETRELRRHLTVQTAHVEALEYFVLHSVNDAVRNRFYANRKRALETKRKLTSKLCRPQKDLAKQLEARGLTFLGCMITPESTAPVRLISQRLSRDYDELEPLLKSIVHVHGAKTGLSFPLAGYPVDQVDTLTHFAQQLEDYGMLHSVNFSEDAIHLQPLFGEMWHNFFSGYWLEQAVINLLSNYGSAWSARRVITNGQFEGKNGDDYEFDLILPTADGGVLLVDSKTGKLNGAVNTIARNVKAAGVSPDRYLVVLPTSEESTIRDWEQKLAGISQVVSIRDLPETLHPHVP